MPTSTRINQAPLDEFTSAHAGFGVLFAYYGVPLWASVIVSLFFEHFENALKDAFPEAFPYDSQDSFENSIVDTLSLSIAHILTTRSMRAGLSRSGKTAVRAAVDATAVGFVGAVTLGFIMARSEQPIGKKTATWGERGYKGGAALGGAYGARKVSKKNLPAIAAGGGGLLAGPMGALVLAYLADRM